MEKTELEISKEINKRVNRVNKGWITEFKDGSKWIMFNSFSFDNTTIYNLGKYEEYLLDTTIDIMSVPTLSLRDFHLMRIEVGVTKEYCVAPKK